MAFPSSVSISWIEPLSRSRKCLQLAGYTEEHQDAANYSNLVTGYRYTINSVYLGPTARFYRIKNLSVGLNLAFNFQNRFYDPPNPWQLDVTLCAALANFSEFNLMFSRTQWGTPAGRITQLVTTYGGNYPVGYTYALGDNLDVLPGGSEGPPPQGMMLHPTDFNDSTAMSGGTTRKAQKNLIFNFISPGTLGVNGDPTTAIPPFIMDRLGLPVFSLSLGDAVTTQPPDYSRNIFEGESRSKDCMIFMLYVSRYLTFSSSSFNLGYNAPFSFELEVF